jgi:nicotinamidase-related amidase
VQKIHKRGCKVEIAELVNDAMPFFKWISDWKEKLPTLDLVSDLDEPASIAVLSVDVTNGFCYEGPLSSPRVAALVPPIVKLFRRAHALGVRHFILPQDTHNEEAVEFGSFPAHCTRGSIESEPVPEFKVLPFFDQFTIMPKNSISSNLGTDLPAWLDAHPEVTTFIVVGDCTDLCTYQLAMYLRLRANDHQRHADRIILPAECVDTYHLPVDAAQELSAYPHHGDLLHLIFLYHMALNGVQVVARVA